MRGYAIIPVFCLLSAAVSGVQGTYDERGNARVPSSAPPRLLVGLATSLTPHLEEGLDHTKGSYSVSYLTWGGSLTAQYHFTEFYLDAGVGLMRLLSLKVNDLKIDMSNRTQWHLPFYAHAYYKLDPLFALGTGITHLTELPMYVDSQKVPDSSYHHIFIDVAAQITPEINPDLKLVFTALVGLNVIPGRQNVYSVGDLLHLRFQFSAGILYRLM